MPAQNNRYIIKIVRCEGCHVKFDNISTKVVKKKFCDDCLMLNNKIRAREYQRKKAML